MIDITDQAIQKIKSLQVEYGTINQGLRFGLTEAGCSSYKYVIEFEEFPSENDDVHNIGGINIFIDRKHINKLRGSTIGWKEDLLQEGFDIDNPQATRPCGCGESINFDRDSHEN